MVARIFGILVTCYLLLVTLVTPTFAQAATPSANLQLPTSISPTSSVYTDLLVHNMFHTFSCLAVGQSVIGQPCLNYVQGVPVLSQVNLQGGTLGAVTGLIGGLYQNPPVRTYESLASLGQTLGIVKEAKAQVVGSGAGVLQPIQTLWQVSRNISYAIMIVIFVVIGLMVMFRQRINPQTVITAQAAIPGLVIGLILITFSYFLAGLISDTAFIGTNLVGAYFSAVKGKPNEPENLVQDIDSKNVLSIFGQFTGIIDQGKAKAALDNIWQALSGWPQFVLTTLAVFLTAQMTAQGTEFLKAIPSVGAGIQAIIVGGASVATAAKPTDMIGIALAFIASIILIYAMLRLLLRLINNFLTIIFLTITAPFQFLFASLPGRQGLATNWILQMISNALAFPAVIAVFYFVAFVLGPSNPSDIFKTSDSNQMNNNALVAAVYAQEKKIDIVGSTTFPLFGGLGLEFIRLLLAFGALVALPAIPDIIAKSIGAVSQAGQLIGQEIGAGVGQGQRYYGQFQSGVGSTSGQLAQARGLFNTSAYAPVIGTGMDQGKVIGFKPSEIQYTPGGISKIGTWWRSKTAKP